MDHRLNGIVSWLLSPVALYLGLKVRSRTPRLLPPSGPKSGHIGPKRNPAYRILVIGDSSAAGVGVDEISETIGPQLAHILHRETNSAVSWRIAGANSAISEEVRDHVVPNLERETYTHIILCVGTNDMKNFLTDRRFKRGFGGLLYALHAKWPDTPIIWTPMLDMTTVPGLPSLLGRILQMRAGIINRRGRQLCRERHATVAPPLQSIDPAGFSVDGFHASAAGYHYWAGVLAQTIVGQCDGEQTATAPSTPAGSEPHPS
ncbi:MAG: SGNH/GDSL hydrolase family protein [Alphaproteobacteria bacterium]|nr:SGNH/GDSL hydrolase family protein [Alphaproteobacteria bacterium]